MIETFLRWLGFGLCHQLPERSFFGGAYQVPVCARDTGIYLGFVVSFALLVALSRRRRFSDIPGPAVIALIVGSVVLLGWDGVTSYAGLRTTTNEIRLATGLLMGWTLPALILPMLNGQLWRRSDRGSVPRGWRETLLWVAPIPAVFALVRWPLEALGVWYPLLVAVAILGTFLIVNLTLVSILPFAEGKAERLVQAWPAIIVALVLVVAEIVASAWLKALLIGFSGPL